MARGKLTHDECCALVKGVLEKAVNTLLYISKRLERSKYNDEWQENHCVFVRDVLCNINYYGAYLHGMRTMLMRLRDWGLIAEKRGKDGLPMPKGDDLIYNKAIIDLLMSDTCNCDRFVGQGFEQIMFADHERDKKGKLVKCRAYFAKKVTTYQEIK